MIRNCFLFLALTGFINLSSQEEIIQDWVSYYQYVNIEDHIGKKFKVSGYIKMKNADEDAKAAIWVRVDDDKDGYTFFENKASENIIIDRWKKFEVVGEIKESSSILNFGAYCKLNGEFYFDNFQLQILNDSGIWEEIKINNGSFETDEDIMIPSWNYGVSKYVEKVKGFNASYITNDTYHKNRCLLITGKGIVLDKK